MKYEENGCIRLTRLILAYPFESTEERRRDDRLSREEALIGMMSKRGGYGDRGKWHEWSGELKTSVQKKINLRDLPSQIVVNRYKRGTYALKKCGLYLLLNRSNLYLEADN